MTRPLRAAALVAGAAAVGFWLARAYFLSPPDVIPYSHENHAYVYRLVEFRDLLATGYWSPQWATHFRGGLGAPYFGYYQPGFFYLASLVPWQVDPLRAIGCTVVAALVFGFLATFSFVRSRFGDVGGLIAAVALVAAPYTRNEVLVRGDLSEFTAMMMVPFALHRFLDGLERGRARDLVGLAVVFAAAACTHPAVGLFLGIALGAALPILSVAERNRIGGVRVAAALAVGGGLAGFYALPVALEVEHVASERAFAYLWDYTRWFITPFDLFFQPPLYLFPIGIGVLLVLMAAGNVAWLLWRPREWAAEQRRLVAVTLVVSAAMLFIMSPLSALLWEHFPPLPKVQFPGRALSILTPALACVAGAVGGSGWLPQRRALLVLLALASLAHSVTEMTPGRPVSFPHVTRAADLPTAEFFKPDVADEWLPRTANRFLREAPTEPSVSWGRCRVSDFSRTQGAVAVRVAENASGCFVTLPHFHFPLGWQVRINGAEHPEAKLEAGEKGYMRVGVPPGAEGRVEVRFAMTPVRRVGWGVTAASATLGVLGLVLMARWARR